MSFVRTEHFTLSWDNGIAAVAYDLPLGRIDNGLAQLVADELGATLLAATPDQLADVITAIVLSTDDDPAVAWSGFYARTLERLSAKREQAGLVCGDQVEVFASVYRYAAQLLRGRSVLDVASCLGFWPLMLAARGYQVTAVDTDHRAMALLATIARRRATSVHTLVADATRLPCRSGAFATAISIHLLEHLDAADTMRAIDELLRACVDRAIVAVPFEKEPTAAFGHVRCFDMATLQDLGATYRGRHGVTRITVTEHHGGWIVLEKNESPRADESRDPQINAPCLAS
jgi:SAM-dependent methyltransferase